MPISQRLLISNAKFYQGNAERLRTTAISERDRARTTEVGATKNGVLDVLELGCGFGGTAAALADLGHNVLGLDCSARRVIAARRHLCVARPGRLDIRLADFRRTLIDARFDVVGYWNGFGVGADSDQLQLLRRIRRWLRRDGVALIDIFDPNWWRLSAGRATRVAGVERRLGFEGRRRRLTTTYVAGAQPARRIVESLRCYSLDEIQRLAARAGLRTRRRAKGGFAILVELRRDDAAPQEK